MFPSISRDNWTRSREKLRGWRCLCIRRRWRGYRVVQHSWRCGHRRLRVSWRRKSHRRRSQRSWRGRRECKWFLRLWARLFFMKRFIGLLYRKLEASRVHSVIGLWKVVWVWLWMILVYGSLLERSTAVMVCEGTGWHIQPPKRCSQKVSPLPALKSHKQGFRYWTKIYGPSKHIHSQNHSFDHAAWWLVLNALLRADGSDGSGSRYDMTSVVNRQSEL